jgi:membrane-bound lytic murein transglycosylase
VRSKNGKILVDTLNARDSLPCHVNLLINHQDRIISREIQNFLKSQDISGQNSEAYHLADALAAHINCEFQELSKFIELQGVTGKDSSGCVLFTAYYTPEYLARKNKDSIYSVPIYSTEKLVQLPTDSNIIDSTGYEVLAYLSSPYDRYQIYLQGSAKLLFENGESWYLIYSHDNGKSFRPFRKLFEIDSLRKLIGTSAQEQKSFAQKYPKLTSIAWASSEFIAFFRKNNKQVYSSTGIKPIPYKTVAADPSHYQPGTILLAEIPIPDGTGNLDYFKYQLLYVVDRGGFIRDDAHLDLYLGEGHQAAKKAALISHYGRVWQLKSRDN